MNFFASLCTKKNGLKQLRIETQKKVDCTNSTKNGDSLTVQYIGKLEDGTEFDNSYKRDKPFSFVLGFGQVCEGFDIGVRDMCEGEKRKLVIPPHLAYGDQGLGKKILPGATLIFEIELLEISKEIDFVHVVEL